MEFNVSLGDRTYPIIIERGIAASLPSRIRPLFTGRRFALVTNTTIDSCYGELIARWESVVPIVKIVLPDGEKYKTIQTWSSILDKCLEAGLDRSSVLIAFGGGVIGDLTGFAAATFLRGVDFIQVPTTLLAMVDSSVGGKTGVDHPLGKNLIGAFYQPRLVWIDTAFLGTLPPRDFLAGYAELFKYAFIGGPGMFNFVIGNHNKMINRDHDILLDGIHRSIEIKARVVESDEKESGNRALLNFGHTFAHSLEKYFGFDSIQHGEAVFWGMKCAISLARLTNTLSAVCHEEFARIESMIPLPALPAVPDIEALYNGMFSDKKARHGKLRFVLPVTPGESILTDGPDRQSVISALVDVFSG